MSNSSNEYAVRSASSSTTTGEPIAASPPSSSNDDTSSSVRSADGGVAGPSSSDDPSAASGSTLKLVGGAVSGLGGTLTRDGDAAPARPARDLAAAAHAALSSPVAGSRSLTRSAYRSVFSVWSQFPRLGATHVTITVREFRPTLDSFRLCVSVQKRS